MMIVAKMKRRRRRKEIGEGEDEVFVASPAVVLEGEAVVPEWENWARRGEQLVVLNLTMWITHC